MRILVAGASSVLGLPTIRELRRRGHDVHGLTRSERHTATIRDNGATPVIGDVFDAASIGAVLERMRPEALVSLLITLPRFGPRRVGDYDATVELWRRGVPKLLDAAAAAGVRRVVAESVVFGYGYDRFDAPLDESDAYVTTPTGGALGRVLASLHEMERRVLEHGDLEGSVLRYGLFHGPAVPTTRLLVSGLRWRLPVVPGQGRGVLSWVELSDAATATADAVVGARPGQLYNITDDEPVAFRGYVVSIADTLGLARPRRIPMWLARLIMPLPARFLDVIRLPVSNAKAKDELGWHPRHRNVAEMAQLLARELGREGGPP